jgi:hypothetical protein
MSIPRYKAQRITPIPGAFIDNWDVLDLAADGKVILTEVPDEIVIDVVESLNHAYDTGVADGAASERIGRPGRRGTLG